MSEQYQPLSVLEVTREQIENCAFSSWYPNFKKHVPKAKVISPLPENFIKYLEQDGIKLPKEGKSFYNGEIIKNDDNDYSDWEDDEDEEAKELKKDEINPLNDFPELHQEIKDTIKEFGSVTPKLNWSAPKDATWILPNNSMKCSEVNEIYLLLNASNYIMHDLQYAFEDCSGSEPAIKRPKYELILREWFDINPALEFRVFVRNRLIIGVSQRDLNYYDYLEPLADSFKDLLDAFVEDEVAPHFPDKDFVLDVYLPRPFERVFLIDINPFCRTTDSLMFSWNELITTNIEVDSDYELRLVKENNTARFACKEHSENHVPRDIVEASLDPNAIRELAQKWKELLAQQEHEDTDSEEEEEEKEGK